MLMRACASHAFHSAIAIQAVHPTLALHAVRALQAHPALMCVEAARTAGAPSTIPPSATSTAGDEDMPDQDLGAQGEQDQDIGEAAQSRLGSFAARSRSVSSSISGCASSFAHQALQVGPNCQLGGVAQSILCCIHEGQHTTVNVMGA